MAVTPVGNPYVESSDLVANYPGASEALAERIDIVGVNPFANAAARDAAIPSPVQGQMCSLNDDNKGYRYDGSAWVLFSGAGDANFTNAATGTYTEGGIDYKYITFTGSDSLEISQAGFADILVIGGGGGGGQRVGGGGGAGGHLYITNAYLPAGTLNVTVGAAGAGGVFESAGIGLSGNNGIASSVGGTFYSPGGGAGAGSTINFAHSANYSGFGLNGASGGATAGRQAGSPPSGSGISGLGSAGGDGVGLIGGGGGGAGAVGGNAISSTGGAGGAGAANSITNSSVTRAGGGGGNGTTGGAAGSGGGGAGGSGAANGSNASINLGGGGGGAGVDMTGGNGGSGLVIVRVVV